jgi:hypothetical protein
MRNTAALLGVLLLGTTVVAVPSASPDDGSPMYMNVEVVALDPLTRLMTVRRPSGSVETVELVDRLAGFGNIAPGDHLILTVQRQPGRAWVSAIMKATPPAATDASNDLHALTSDRLPQSPTPRQSFAVEVATLAQRANRVDGLWNSFRTTCGARVGTSYEGARDWFGFWDDTIRADLSNGFCRELFNKIVDLGEGVKSGMSNAEDTARRSLPPGSIREIRRHYAMDWDGWDRVPPARLTR